MTLTLIGVANSKFDINNLLFYIRFVVMIIIVVLL